MAEDWTEEGFGLYVHWPFCAAKCPYCDFNSHVSREIDEFAFVRAYLSELDRVAAEVPGRVLNTIYFGGGTPSLMEPNTVGAIIEAAKSHWATSNDMEITLEANPGSVEAGRFAGYRDAGVNRVSIGVQALNDDDLRRLGRIHSVSEAKTALKIAQNTFDRVSFDLIYARQDQTIENWRAELTEALTMAADHLSMYQLTIEQGTAFGDRYNRGKLRGLPTEDLAADMFQLTQELTEKHGLPAYEVSNHARPGSESRHNMIYWRYGDYAGIGPGAHGRITVGGKRQATVSAYRPTDWLERCGKGTGETERTALAGREQAEEYAMMGLRIRDGISAQRFAALAGKPLSAERVAELAGLGMLNIRGDSISVTDQGVMLLNTILESLLAD